MPEQVRRAQRIAVHQPHPVADLRRLGGQGLAKVGEQRRRAIQARDRVTAAGQPQQLGALPAADVEHPPDRAASRVRHVRGQLPPDQLLPYHLAQRP